MSLCRRARTVGVAFNCGSSAAPKFGDEAGICAKFGDMDIGTKLGETDRGSNFGEAEAGVTDVVKFGDADNSVDDGKKFGEVADRVTDEAGEKFGDVDWVITAGLRLGDIAKESVRFEDDDAVANRAGKFGDREPGESVDMFSAYVLGHIESESSSIWSWSTKTASS